ncbi:helix-turn-helix domain-containing protein [Salmonella enterica]|nr:helix-turn-helix domain-containing protein [Salmonella enterica]
MQKKVLADLLLWIETHIDEKISSCDLVNVAGYSRRHLLNIFLNHTGLPPGKYIRYRKLCRAAFMLKLTKRKILDIAFQLKFDSQQSFSREFRKLFHCTPYQYRIKEDWDFTNLKLPITLVDNECIKYDFCELSSKEYHGYHFSYERPIYKQSNDEELVRFRKIIKSMKECSTDIFVSTTFEPHAYKENYINVTTFIGFANVKDANIFIGSERFTSNSGLYIKIPFEGGG